MSTVNDHDQGVSINRIEHRTSKIEMRINSALIGPWPKHILVRFIGSEKLNDSQPNAETKKVDGWKSKSKSKTRTATIQRVLLVSAATSKYHIRTAVHSIKPTASTGTQPHRPSPVNSQQANHNTIADVLGPLFPGVRAKADNF